MSSSGTSAGSASASLTNTILKAFENTLGPSQSGVLASLKAQATALAQGIAVVGSQRRNLTGDQAEALLTSYVDAAEAGLAADVATEALNGPALIKAALEALAQVGLTAVGLAWLDPVVDDVIDAIDPTPSSSSQPSASAQVTTETGAAS